MKPTAKVKSAPPICGVGGGAYSREISSHAYAPVIIRKNRVKRDVASQFILCTTCADEVRPNEFQSARQDYVGKKGEVPCAAGKPRAKTVSHQVKWNNYVHSSIADGRATLTPNVAKNALALLEAQKIAREHKEQMRLANLRATAHLHIKRVEKKALEKRLNRGKGFSIEQAFAGL